jgi:molecular chaperone GrpE
MSGTSNSAMNGNGKDDPFADELAPEGGAEPQADLGVAAEQAAALGGGPDPRDLALIQLEKERDEAKEQLLRALAETENVRKRGARQVDEARMYAMEKFARDMLAVGDNLARAVKSLPDGIRAMMPDYARTLVEGVELTEKELVAALARNGVAPIDASPGTAFDPALHQAVTQIPSHYPAGAIAQQFQSGWKIGDRTLRPAMVAVSAGQG